MWRLCDGERTVREIAAEAGIAEDPAKRALRTLEDAQLLDAPLATVMRGMQSRRRFMKKAGIAAIPAIVSITAPIAKAAASPGIAARLNAMRTQWANAVIAMEQSGFSAYPLYFQLAEPHMVAG